VSGSRDVTALSSKFPTLTAQELETLQATWQAEDEAIQQFARRGRFRGSNHSARTLRKAGDSEEFIDEWMQGVRLGFRHAPRPFFRHSYKSVTDNMAKTSQELLRLVQNKKLLPLKVRPHVVSPLGAIIKPNKTRLVHDLSISGVNDALDVPPLKLVSVDKALRLLSHDSWLGKLDVSDMFLNYAVHPSEQAALGIQHPITGQFYVMPYVPFGLASAPAICARNMQRVGEKLSVAGCTALQITATNNTGLSNGNAAHTNYMDDFLITAKRKHAVAKAMEAAHRVFRQAGIQVKKEKKQKGQAQVLSFLGIEINCRTNSLALTREKLIDIKMQVEQMWERRKTNEVQIGSLRQLIGKLMWAIYVVPTGMSYLPTLWKQFAGLPLHSLRKRSKTIVHPHSAAATCHTARLFWALEQP